MSKISEEYKEMMEKEKQVIKKIGERVVDAYETEDFLVIVSISKNHVVWEHSFFKIMGTSARWCSKTLHS